MSLTRGGERFIDRLTGQVYKPKPKTEAEIAAEKKKKEEIRILMLNEELKEAKKITVADMIKALSELPPDAKLVMTQAGFYANSSFANIMLPEQLKDTNEELIYCIGDSFQGY
jgi:hypothetical protein